MKNYLLTALFVAVTSLSCFGEGIKFDLTNATKITFDLESDKAVFVSTVLAPDEFTLDQTGTTPVIRFNVGCPNGQCPINRATVRSSSRTILQARTIYYGRRDGGDVRRGKARRMERRDRRGGRRSSRSRARAFTRNC